MLLLPEPMGSRVDLLKNCRSESRSGSVSMLVLVDRSDMIAPSLPLALDPSRADGVKTSPSAVRSRTSLSVDPPCVLLTNHQSCSPVT